MRSGKSESQIPRARDVGGKSGVFSGTRSVDVPSNDDLDATRRRCIQVRLVAVFFGSELGGFPFPGIDLQPSLVRVGAGVGDLDDLKGTAPHRHGLQSASVPELAGKWPVAILAARVS